MFKKINFDSNCIFKIMPSHLSHDFIYLLHLLSDESIMLTFNEREEIYKLINKLIKLLEEKKNNGSYN